MSVVEGSFSRSRVAANAGDPDAAREFGRLLGLLDIEGDADGTLPCERWLRSAVAARPDDAEAAVLLAGRLAQQAGRKREEARELYERVLRADPEHPAARAGLAAVQGRLDEAGADGYGYYLVQGEYWSGTDGRRERLVVADPHELRWACDAWLADCAPSSFHIYELSVCTAGERLSTTNLGAVVPAADGSLNWDAVAIPPLPTEPLPVGHPVRIDGVTIHYGWGVIEL
jgi:hypothetical protein